MGARGETYHDSGVFHLSESLERIGQLRLKGCLHVFAPTISGSFFVEEGAITFAECNGKMGEQAVRPLLEAPNTVVTWVEDVLPPHRHARLQISAVLLDFQIHCDTEASRVPTPASKTDTRPLFKFRTGMLPKVSEEAPSRFRLANYGTGETITLRRNPSILGREATTDVTVAHPSVSRRHCMLRFTRQGLHVTDLGSTNGIAFNGMPAIDGVLNVGDRLAVGDVELVVMLTEEAQAAEPGQGAPALPARM